MDTRTKDRVSAVNHCASPLSGTIKRAMGPVNAHKMVKHKPNNSTAIIPSLTDASCHRFVKPYKAQTI